MKAIFVQSGPGLSIEQGGLGPVVELGFGASGAAASIGTAPLYAAVLETDTVLLERDGELIKVPASALMAFVGTAQQVAVALAAALYPDNLPSEAQPSGGPYMNGGFLMSSRRYTP